MSESITAVEAKYEAQKLAFAPIYFQCMVALRKLGILRLISNKRKGINIDAICKELDLTDYGVRVLLEAAAVSGVVDYLDENTVKITKVGYFILKDKLTDVNINYVDDVCYDGAKAMTESIRNGKPEGLKVFGEWETLYEGLAHLPEQVKKSWFEFDHYYSDDAFPHALKIVNKSNPKYIFDIGGNTGKWAIACCGFNETVKVKILDLPGQLNVAKENIKERNLTDRIDFHQIDLLDSFQKIPQGADTIWMSQFLDCFSEEEIISILKNVYQASDDNTNVYIMELFYDNQVYKAAEYCLIGTSLYFTTMANGNSKMYSIKVMYELIKKSGFEVVEEFSIIGNSYHTVLRCKKA